MQDHHRKYAFMLTCLFFIQYKYVWFENYSKAFAGDRMSSVQSGLEKVFQDIYQVKLVMILVNLLSDMFLISLYMK